MMVKICGITNRADALAAVEVGASAIGFNFYRDSPRYISATAAAAIAEKLPENIWKVGIFVNETAEFIAKTVLDASLDIVQLYGTSQARDVRIWRACKADQSLLTHIADETAEALLVDTPSEDSYGGTGRTFDWARVRGLPKKVVLAGGLDGTNVRRAIEAAQPWGVDACSRIEKSPGVKDHAKMKEFVQAALKD